jgi:hypothetical protein
MKTFSIALAAVLLLLAAQTALGKPRAKELGYEAASSMVRLPASEDGELTFQACTTCKVLRLRATAKTRYVIGEERVSLAELTKYLSSHPDSGMLVAQLNGTFELSRIQVYVPPAK